MLLFLLSFVLSILPRRYLLLTLSILVLVVVSVYCALPRDPVAEDELMPILAMMLLRPLLLFILF